jgi:hypothetical protein
VAVRGCRENLRNCGSDVVGFGEAAGRVSESLQHSSRGRLGEYKSLRRGSAGQIFSCARGVIIRALPRPYGFLDEAWLARFSNSLCTPVAS